MFTKVMIQTICVLFLFVSISCSQDVRGVENTSQVVSTLDSLRVEKGFRNTHWGMSKIEVRKVEVGSFISEPSTNDYQFYESSVGGFPCTILYKFINDSLVIGMYTLEHQHSNEAMFLNDFAKLKSSLTLKYGAPKDDYETYRFPYEKGDGHTSTALVAGYVIYLASWIDTTSNTRIWMDLEGDNYKISFTIHYESLTLEPLVNRERSIKNTEGL